MSLPSERHADLLMHDQLKAVGQRAAEKPEFIFFPAPSVRLPRTDSHSPPTARPPIRSRANGRRRFISTAERQVMAAVPEDHGSHSEVTAENVSKHGHNITVSNRQLVYFS